MCSFTLPAPCSLSLFAEIEIEKLEKGKSAFHTLLKHSVQFEINQNTISLRHDIEVLCIKCGKSICGTQLCFKNICSDGQAPPTTTKIILIWWHGCSFNALFILFPVGGKKAIKQRQFCPLCTYQADLCQLKKVHQWSQASNVSTCNNRTDLTEPWMTEERRIIIWDSDNNCILFPQRGPSSKSVFFLF